MATAIELYAPERSLSEYVRWESTLEGGVRSITQFGYVLIEVEVNSGLSASLWYLR